MKRRLYGISQVRLGNAVVTKHPKLSVAGHRRIVLPFMLRLGLFVALLCMVCTLG